MKIVNSKAVVVTRYDAGLIKWTKNELRATVIKARKTVAMQRPQRDVDRFHMPRNKGGPSP